MDEFNNKIKAFVKDILNDKVKELIKSKLSTEMGQKLFIASLYELALVDFKGKLLENRETINFTTFRTLNEID